MILVGQSPEPEKRSGMWNVQMADENRQEVWMDSKTLFHPIAIITAASVEALPEELRAWVKEWRDKRHEIAAAHHPDWYSKRVSTKFVYENNYYELDPVALGLSQELFECIQDELEEELEWMGSPYIRSYGLLD